MTGCRTYLSIGTLTIVIAICAASCGGGLTPKLAADNESGISEESPASTEALRPDAGVLEACQQELQESVMLIGEVPDLDALGISTCYQLWLNLLSGQQEFEGEARITYTNNSSEPQSDLVFRLYPNAPRVYDGNLEVTSARVDDELVNPEVFLSDRTGLRLKLNQILNPGDTVMVQLEFQGQLNDSLESSNRAYGIYNYSQDVEAATYANWYPILAEWEHGEWQAQPVLGVGDAVVSEAALYIVKVSASQELQIVTSGMEVKRTSNDSMIEYTFASGPVRDFIVISGKNFILTKSEAGGILVTHWGLPGGEGRSAEALQAAVDAIGLFSKQIGQYPYRELDVVSVPLNLASGVEYPGLFLMRDDLYLPNSEQPFLLSLIVAHESAHQWWYALVGNDVLEHPWQDEALTTFTSLLYLEKFQSRVYSETVEYFTQISDDLGQDASIGRSANSFITEPELYSPIVYSRGAIFFVELRRKIGDDDFFEALRNYFEQNLYQHASPNDLLMEFSKACECELDEFFDYWGLGAPSD